MVRRGVTVGICLWLCSQHTSASAPSRPRYSRAETPVRSLTPVTLEPSGSYSLLRVFPPSEQGGRTLPGGAQRQKARRRLSAAEAAPALAVSPRVRSRQRAGSGADLEVSPRSRSRSGVDSGGSIRSSQGPEGFAYEVSHPVLDEYGKLATATQYHGQDGLGRYRYSYRHPGTEREEYVDENGRVQGSYSYRSDDEDKISMSYMADDTGFHVVRANLPPLASRAPRDDPLVAAIKAAHIHLWRRMWLKAAMASLGRPVSEEELDQMVPTVALPAAEVETNVEEQTAENLESDLIDVSVDAPPAAEETPAPPEEPLVPLFPGAPGAPATPVGSAPQPLPETASGVESPDDETIIIGADGDSSAPGGGRGYDEFTFQPVGALRYRDGSRVISGGGGRPAEAAALLSSVVTTPHESVLIEARSARTRARISAALDGVGNPDRSRRTQTASAADARAPSAELPTGRQQSPTLDTNILSRSDSAVSRGAELRGRGQARLRVSEEAARAGAVPVAARHDRAQLSPTQQQQLLQAVAGPVLDDPLLYYYSSLLQPPQRRPDAPEIVVV